MTVLRRYLGCMIVAACVPHTAFAHVGHIGELAGHGHLIGLAGLAGAAVMAGLLAKWGKKTDASVKANDESDEPQTEDESKEVSHG